MARHEDLNDQDQTVTVGTPQQGNGTATGDMNVLPFIIIGAGAAAVVIALLIRNKRKKK